MPLARFFLTALFSAGAALCTTFLRLYRTRRRRRAAAIIDLPLPVAPSNPQASLLALLLTLGCTAALVGSTVWVAHGTLSGIKTALLAAGLALVFFAVAELALHISSRLSLDRLRMDRERLDLFLPGEQSGFLDLRRPFRLASWLAVDAFGQRFHKVWDVEQNGITVSFYYPPSLLGGEAHEPPDRWLKRPRGIYLGAYGTEILKRLAAAQVTDSLA